MTTIFDLEYIKRFFKPIEELQGKLNYLNSILNKYYSLSESFGSFIENEELITDFEEFSLNIKKINKKLLEILNSNLNKYIIFQDILIKKYKDAYVHRLKQKNVDQNFKLGYFEFLFYLIRILYKSLSGTKLIIVRSSLISHPKFL